MEAAAATRDRWMPRLNSGSGASDTVFVAVSREGRRTASTVHSHFGVCAASDRPGFESPIARDLIAEFSRAPSVLKNKI